MNFEGIWHKYKILKYISHFGTKIKVNSKIKLKWRLTQRKV